MGLFSVPSTSLVAALPRVDERGAFDALYRDHKSYVWHTLRRLGVSASDRADLVHDVFVVLWKRRDDRDDDLPVKPWLFGIAHKIVLSHRRRLVRHPEDVNDDLEQVASVAPAQDDVIDKKRAQILLARGLASMEIEQRAVFILHDIDGENVAACARALEVSVNTLYSRLRLARKKLADVVEDARIQTAKDGGR